MTKRDTVRIGLVGSQFITTIHAEALRLVPQAEVVAVTSPTKGHARDFAAKYGIPHHERAAVADPAIAETNTVVRGAPHFAHCEMTQKAAQAAKHAVVEKPLCLKPEDDDRMIGACEKARIKLIYPEELCFAPK